LIFLRHNNSFNENFSGKALPMKWTFCNRDFKRSTSRSQNFPFFILQISLEKGKFFTYILAKYSKNNFNPAFWAILS